MDKKSTLSKTLRTIGLIFWGIFAMFPVYWIIITSFKQSKDIYQGPFLLPFVDFQPTIAAWTQLTGPSKDQFTSAFINSISFASVSALIAVLLGSFAGYGLARYSYKYGNIKNDDLSFLIVSQRIMPPIVAVIALFAMFSFIKLLDTKVGMILVYTWFNLPLTVYIIKDFISRIPRDIEYAAAIDGYGKIHQIFRISLPLAMPGLAVAYLLAFFFSWNDFLLALMLTFRKASTLPIMIMNLSASNNPQWWFISAVGILSIIPPIIAVIVLDRFIVRRLLSGGTRQ